MRWQDGLSGSSGNGKSRTDRKMGPGRTDQEPQAPGAGAVSEGKSSQRKQGRGTGSEVGVGCEAGGLPRLLESSDRRLEIWEKRSPDF